MKIRLLLIAAALLIVAAASADLTAWQVRCGLANNVLPYTNDFYTRFGVGPQGTWDRDIRDTIHPPADDPATSLGFVYTDKYWQVYRDQTPHDVDGLHWDAPLGWPPPYIDWPSATTYPSYYRAGSGSSGLIVDTRSPFTEPGQVAFWTVKLSAPWDGSTCSFRWELDPNEGLEVPLDLDIRIWSNPDLIAAGIMGDLVLTDWGSGVNKVTGIPQFGFDYDAETPITHTWIIQATVLAEPRTVPEPSAAVMLGAWIAALGLALRRRK